MKSTPQISSDKQASHSDTPHHHPRLPLTDYSYQSTVETRASSNAVADETHTLPQWRTFRKVSREFFGAEATREYVLEAIFFAWVSGVAAWPVAVMMHQLMRWTI
jgi:hypothetical protein